MNITKQKHTHSYKEQPSGYHWGEGREEELDGVEDQEVQTAIYKINKL